MNHVEKFLLNDQSTVRTLDAAGVSELVAGVKAGATIRASQNVSDPIRIKSESQQSLECETSGSTGQPKTIRRRPASWTTSFEITGKQFGIDQNETYAVLGSLGHSLSLFAALEALYLGADLCVLSSISPKRQLQALADQRVTVIYATPTQLELLSVTANREALCDVRIVFVGGGMLSELAKDRHSHLFQNAEIIQFYGTSETSFITLTDSNTPEGSVGRPYPAVQLRLSGVEQFSGSGEVCVQSPYLFDGYVDYVGPNGTENDGFFRTGEVGYQDTEGYLFLKGRVDRMVTISDVNVHPEAIETAVSSLAYVDACAVVTKPDEKRGHRAVCFIVSQSLDGTPAKIRQHCRSVLGACYVPKEVRIISELPMLASGKPDLRALTKQIADL